MQCSELGSDSTSWSKIAPLPPPIWFKDQVSIFREAVREAAAGNRTRSVEILQTIRSDEMREWFCDHGQWSGRHRSKHLDLYNMPSVCELDINRSPAKYERAVFERDCYTCRYCGLPVVAKPVLLAFEKVVGTDAFRNVGKNAEQHGIVHAFKVVADHVSPFKRGGKTDLDNLVTACPACNYGKDHYTVEQLGIFDPRDRPPQPNEWDGLTSFMPGLKAHSGAFELISHR
jgi:5-methylcytosine-specific restriction endonuclease McrA